MKIGKYIVDLRASSIEGGRFAGSVLLLWDEADATIEKLVHFHKSFESEEAAKEHAAEQTRLRVNDGVW